MFHAKIGINNSKENVLYDMKKSVEILIKSGVRSIGRWSYSLLCNPLLNYWIGCSARSQLKGGKASKTNEGI